MELQPFKSLEGRLLDEPEEDALMRANIVKALSSQGAEAGREYQWIKFFKPDYPHKGFIVLGIPDEMTALELQASLGMLPDKNSLTNRAVLGRSWGIMYAYDLDRDEVSFEDSYFPGYEGQDHDGQDSLVASVRNLPENIIILEQIRSELAEYLSQEHGMLQWKDYESIRVEDDGIVIDGIKDKDTASNLYKTAVEYLGFQLTSINEEDGERSWAIKCSINIGKDIGSANRTDLLIPDTQKRHSYIRSNKAIETVEALYMEDNLGRVEIRAGAGFRGFCIEGQQKETFLGEMGAVADGLENLGVAFPGFRIRISDGLEKYNYIMRLGNSVYRGNVDGSQNPEQLRAYLVETLRTFLLMYQT